MTTASLPHLRPPRMAIAALALLLALLWTGAVTAAGAAPSSSFDHRTTGFELTGRHRDARCESCHVNAIFKGTARECVTCHSRGSLVGATAKPADHVLSSERCSECHTTAAFIPATRFQHDEVRGSCQSCHNNTRAIG